MYNYAYFLFLPWRECFDQVGARNRTMSTQNTRGNAALHTHTHTSGLVQLDEFKEEP